MRIALIIIIFTIIEWYNYVFVSGLTQKKGWLIFYVASNVLFLSFILYFFLTLDRSKGQTHYSMMIMGVLLMIFLPKILITVLFLIQDIIRLMIGVFQKMLFPSSSFLPERRRFVTQLGLAVAAIPFLSVLYGISKGKYNFKVHKHRIYFDDLPDSFDGFKILQISDLHCGSFDDAEKIQYGINLINEQDFDLAVFTGDLVNSLSEEVDPWIEILSQIRTPEFGKFSILGNHDYGEYVTFESEQKKEENFSGIKNQHQKMGFRLMLNENVYLNKGTDKMALVGLENWGMNFKKAGDLQMSSQGLSPKDFKIVLTHDPSHWDAEIVGNEQNYQLTLSGHTHGMQFGIEIPGWIKWSPVKYLYKQWAGLYQKGKQFIYVNRGFGFHAYPGRVGIMPEITVLELKKSI